MKKTFFLFVLLLSSFSMIAQNFEVDGIKYSVVSAEDLTVIVTGYNSNYEGDLEINGTVSFNDINYKIISIAGGSWMDSPFHNCNKLKRIGDLPYCTSIESYAFFNCDSLVSVGNLCACTSLGINIFEKCDGLKSVGDLSGLTSLPQGTFWKCNMLTTVGDLSGCTSIGNAAFAGCNNLTSVIDLSSCTSINEYAFENCSSLTSILFGNSLTSITHDAFNGCSNLNEVISEIMNPSSVSIGSNAFANTPSDKMLIIPEGTLSAYQSASQWTQWFSIMNENNNISVEDISLQAGETKTVSICLTNTETNLVGFQMDLTLPEGISINKAECSLGSRIVDPDQVLTIGKQGDNIYRLTSTSFALTPISGTSGTLLTLSLTAAENAQGGTATLSDIVFATNNSDEVTMDDASFNITIIPDKEEQTLTLASLPAMTYGDANYTLPESTEEGLTLTWESSNATVANISGNTLTVGNAGTATITATQAGNDDYVAFSREYTLTVGKAALTITANDCSKVEGEENPELTVSYEGFVNDDDASVLTQQPTVTTETTTASPAGSYPITVSGAEAANYDISYVAGTLTVEEAPLEPTDISQMDNAIYVEKAQGGKGGSGTIVISLKNAQAATAYQFNLKLPEGVTLKTNNEGEYTCTLSSRHRGHNANINTLEDEGVYRIVVSSMQSKMIDGNDGTVLTIPVDVSDDLELGSYPIFIQDARYSLSGGTVIRMQETVGVFDVEDFLLGDVNEDGDIDVGDVVCIVNNSIGKPNEKFVEKAADVDYDGEIDIADAVKLVNFIIKKITVLSHHGIDNTTIDLPEPQ